MPTTPSYYMGASSSPGYSILIQFPANANGKAVEDDPNVLAPMTHLGDSDGVQGSQLQPGPVRLLQLFGD